ncbi:MAG: ABC transporter ATP-binding protein [Lachnospiraceae bacterium]
MLEVSNIQKSYGKRTILADISFSANQGDCVAIVGANGCGKSTLLGILSGAHKADGGKITCFDKNLTKAPKLFSQYIGYVPQENPLMDKLSVYDNLRFWYCDSKKDLKKELESGIPAMFGLDFYRDYSVDKLSGGMKKRLSIACALAKDPPVLILDEPGASLDIICKEDIKNYLKSYLASGGTVIITSHEDAELSICNKMLLLQNGVLTELPDKPVGGALMERMGAHG